MNNFNSHSISNNNSSEGNYNNTVVSYINKEYDSKINSLIEMVKKLSEENKVLKSNSEENLKIKPLLEKISEENKVLKSISEENLKMKPLLEKISEENKVLKSVSEENLKIKPLLKTIADMQFFLFQKIKKYQDTIDELSGGKKIDIHHKTGKKEVSNGKNMENMDDDELYSLLETRVTSKNDVNGNKLDTPISEKFLDP